MPAQLDPPGHLAVHLEIVALTPILLAWAGALAGAITGAGRSARICATIGITLGLTLLIIDLRRRGLALAVDRVLGREWFAPGIARVSWPTMAAAFAAGIWTLVQSVRSQRSWPRPRDAWNCGLAQALALVPIPALVLFCLKNRDDSPTVPTSGTTIPSSPRARWLLIAIALAMTLVAGVTASPWPYVLTTLLGIVICRNWRIVLLIAALAGCWPLTNVPG